MSNNAAAIMAMRESMQADYKRQKRMKKTDDIIEFIASNWKLFTGSRTQMKQAVDSLGHNGVPYSVDGLCDLLGVPDNVYFKRSPVKDIGAAILDFKHSKLMELLLKCTEAQNGKDVCMFVVAGKSSICITDMQTTMTPGMMLIHLVPAIEFVQDIHIFKAAEASERLPNLFNHAEDNYV